MKRQHRPSIRVPGAALGVGLAALLSFFAAAAVARIVNVATAVTHTTKQGPLQVRGRGPAGLRGFTGFGGPVGATGPAGTPQELEQNVSLNWEGSFANATGRDSQTFDVPGIGTGDFTCSQDTQWIHFVPYDQNTDVQMWTAIFQNNETTVRTGKHTTYTGGSFYVGLNHYANDPQEQGSVVGIISSDGDKLGGVNGAGPPPTTFRLSYYWNFNDPNNPYCFMAATVVSSN